jgi:Na+-translocating ferredoxin:NAD+ oxidoreductase RnfG subunit
MRERVSGGLFIGDMKLIHVAIKNMEKSARFLLLLCLYFFPTSQVEASEIKHRSQELITKQFGTETMITFRKLDLAPDLRKRIEAIAGQRFFRNSIYTWKISKGDTTVGYALLDNVIGKSLPITFLVIFDSDGIILSTHVVKYREAIGGEISNWRWNRQFSGRNYQSSFSAGNDIDGISGATISVNAMTRGIHKLTILIEIIREDL